MDEMEFANDIDRKAFGRKVRELREARHISREAFANICNISTTHMRMIEVGERLPSLPVLISICNELKVSPSYLLQSELTFLTDEAPDPYDRLMEMVLNRSPEEAELLVAVMDLMMRRLK